jgi:NADPH2:quinone reductase
MKAIQAQHYGGPEVLKLIEIETPQPGPGQILVKLKAAGINPVDTYILTGTYARKPNLPYTPGMDGAGTVDSVGPNVTGYQPGDRVYIEDAITGTYSEFCLVDKNHVHPLPASLSFSQGAAIGVPYATAHLGLVEKAAAQKGETLLIHGGSGGVGVAAIQLAKVLGLKVIATAGTEEGLRLVQQLGADLALNHHHPDYLSEVTRFTAGKGVDIILEMAAHLNLGKDLPLLSFKGRVIVIGSRGPVEINPRDIMGRHGSIIGLSYLKVTSEENTKIHQDLGRHLKAGTLNPFVGKEIPLRDAAQAHRDIMTPGAKGKIVLIP